MKTIWHGIQILFAAIGGWLGYALGGFDGFLNALVIFISLDYLSGVMCAIIEKKLSSEVGFRGIFKKIMILVLVGIGTSLDRLIGSESVIRTMIIFFYLSNEGLSLLENATKIGIPIPEKLKQILSQLRERESNKNE